MDVSIQPIVSVDPEDEDSFRVMIDAKTRHVDLWTLVMQLGSNKALADSIGCTQSLIGKWINLHEYPSVLCATHKVVVDRLHTMTGKSFDDMWPPGLRRAIEYGRAASRASIAIDTSMIALAESQAKRLILPDPLEEASDAEVKEIIGGVNGWMRFLTHREAAVLRLRFGLGQCDGQTYLLEEVGKMLKISRERVRQIEMKAICKLRDKLRYGKIPGADEFLSVVGDLKELPR